jgi:hypothetical protein
MHLAQERGAEGMAEFVEAFEGTLALARMYRTQPFLIDVLVGMAIESMGLERARALLKTHPDAATLDAVAGAMERQLIGFDPRAMFEGERMAALNTAGWVFTDPKRVRFGGMFQPDVFGMGPGLTRVGAIGSWTANRDSFNSYFERVKQRVATPPRLRDQWVEDAPTGLKVVDILKPAAGRGIQSWDMVTLDEVGTRAMIALERYRAAVGHYPEGLSELVPRYLAAVPEDPWSGAAMCYRRMESAGAGEWGYVLYSVGGDGVDSGGKPAPANSKASVLTKGQQVDGMDYIINDK